MGYAGRSTHWSGAVSASQGPPSSIAALRHCPLVSRVFISLCDHGGVQRAVHQLPSAELPLSSQQKRGGKSHNNVFEYDFEYRAERGIRSGSRMTLDMRENSMKLIFIAVGLLILLTSAQADDFYLTDSSGRKHGPFEFKQDEKLSIGEQVFIISRNLTDEQKVIERMKAIIIPKIDFRQANLHDVVDFLHKASVKNDKEELGVNIVLELGNRTPIPQVADPFADPFAAPVKDDAIPVTFTAVKISMHQAVEIFCRVAGLTWSVEDSTVVMKQKKVQPEN